MTVFVDTSAFFAVLDADDAHHARAAREWRRLLDGEHRLVTSNYVLVETAALVQNRLGLDALKTFLEDVLSVVEVVWVDADTHAAAVSALLISARRRLSLVDCVSFELMRRLGIREAFAFDVHFRNISEG